MNREQIYVDLVNKAAEEFRQKIAHIPAEIEAAVKAAELRDETSRAVLNELARKKAMQEACPHRHDSKDARTTQLVIIKSGNEYLLCQQCLKHIEPTDPTYHERRSEALDAALLSIKEASSRLPGSVFRFVPSDVCRQGCG